ncbi:XTP/dITP diphosphatase [Anaerotalea alkaliphila]|uniref:dITP/XTP pyrophosphatase n=1 Tax=Anaerotalea alkaliphila TaxID=2662126 RepID=A0A7X5KLT7_9FIRM|nr:XTP/dITP diphosphatase [Anaerotalea alkaliphila]NDL67186.1 XTP/dITP diphosphatase [Anaerotalea alkaliphila]
MKRIIFATKNQGKIREINEIMKGSGFYVVPMEEAGIDLDVEEDGSTFEENAIKKAVEIMEASNSIVLADDSGLEVDHLDKAPGVYSARFAGVDTPYAVKNQMIMDKLADVHGEDRSARFVCVVAAAFPDGRVATTRGTIEGRIAYESKGDHGFGYDPIFYVPSHGCTTAEMPLELKNRLSHRGKALEAMKQILMEYAEGIFEDDDFGDQ